LYVQLLEWMPASPNAGNCGLNEYVLAISEAVATITTAPSRINRLVRDQLLMLALSRLAQKLRQLGDIRRDPPNF
jgi:hypothetical protein